MDLTDEDRVHLSAAEIAALEAPDPDDEQETKDEEPAEPTAETTASEAAAAATQPATEAEPVAEAPATASVEADDTEDARPSVGVTTPDVEDYDTKIKSLRARKAEAFKKLMDGDQDMTAELFAEIETDVDAQAFALMNQRAEHRAEARRAAQSSQAEWQWECKRFLRDVAKSEGIDYTADPKLGKELDAQVKALAGDPDNRSRTGEWFLEQAHKRVKAIHSIGVKQTSEKVAVAAIEQARKPDLTNVPPTLAKVPVAAQASVDADEFAHLRNLSGMDYEKAIARMTPDQLERFMV